MTNFYTSDHHFYHKKIIELANRPFKTMEEMHKTMIDNWNKIVKDKDTVFIVGDFVLGTSKKNRLYKQLNGNKILIKGNHDSLNSSNLVGAYVELLDKGAEVVHDPNDSSSSITIHGHIHQKQGQQFKKYSNGRMFINVNVELWDYKPVKEKQIIELLKNNGVRFSEREN